MSDEEMSALINSMCLTWRHDFGLDREADSEWGIACGMTEHERNGLRLQMRQLVEHHFLPLLAERQPPRQRRKIQQE